MALPNVTIPADCADFSLTVLPYIPQLYELPTQIFGNYNDLEALKLLYVSTNPLISAFAFALFISPIFLIVSEVNKNYSQVDRCWSILPTLYNIHYCVWAHLAGLSTARLDNLVAFSIVWSLRLTFNYWRKGGYSIGSEDYRWAVLREKISPFVYFLFNVSFISLGQSILLFLITTPSYLLTLTTLTKGGDVMSTADNLFVRGLLTLVIIEWFADGSQWKFHEAKAFYQKHAQAPFGYPAQSLDLGFNTLGLFAYSRHPNFAAEQAIWVALYQWGCWTTNTLVNWTFAGAVGYLILFQASTWFTEKITAKKYPEYKRYQKHIGKFVPNVGSVWSLVNESEEVALKAKEEKEAAQQKKLADKKSGKITRDPPKRRAIIKL